MSVFGSIDIRTTEAGRRMLEEGGARAKEGKGNKVWPKGRGPKECGHCFGYCCGWNA